MVPARIASRAAQAQAACAGRRRGLRPARRGKRDRERRTERRRCAFWRVFWVL